MKDDFMKKDNDDYELREEYDLSQMLIMPKGRYAPKRQNVVVLTPDMAEAFPDNRIERNRGVPNDDTNN